MLIDKHSEALFPTWSHHAFVTNRTGHLRDEDLHHRAHAVVEPAIRDLKDNGPAHCPSGRFNGNAAWLCLAALARNLTRWAISIGTGRTEHITGATIRRKIFTVPGRMAHSARRCTLHLPTHWPWTTAFTGILDQLRTVNLAARTATPAPPRRSRPTKTRPPSSPLTSTHPHPPKPYAHIPSTGQLPTPINPITKRCFRLERGAGFGVDGVRCGRGPSCCFG